jgi:hypothetical protein
MYEQNIERELMQHRVGICKGESFMVAIVRCTVMEHKVVKTVYYEVRFHDSRATVFKANETNMKRAFYIYDTIAECL